MSDLFDMLSEDERERLREKKQPSWTSPMLAKLEDEPFSDRDWIYERKLDGERCLAFRKGSSLRLLSRNREALNHTYPEIEEALAEENLDEFVVDGEVVAFDGNVTSFSRLQGRMKITDPDEARHSGIAVYYYVFDILHAAGHDTTKLPLRTRKKLLKRALDFGQRVRFTAHRNADGEKYLEEACRRGWEGIMAKEGSSEYVHSRSPKWLKLKCGHGQELVIGGYTDPKGERTDFGALLVGYYDGDDLVYAGKVGTGFDEETLHDLGAKLRSMERKTPPFSAEDLPRKGVHWVTRKLVGEVAFTEWTDDGKLRHPRYKGLRRDKDAGDVVREG